jgi:hypothetical protein
MTLQAALMEPERMEPDGASNRAASAACSIEVSTAADEASAGDRYLMRNWRHTATWISRPASSPQRNMI